MHRHHLYQWVYLATIDSHAKDDRLVMYIFFAAISHACFHGDCARYYTQKRLGRASKKLGIPELTVYDQFEDKRVGLRMCTFTSNVQDLGNGVKVCA